MKSAAAFALGLMVALMTRPNDAALQTALADYAETTRELRASSAALRDECRGPRMRKAPYRRAI